MNIIEAKEILNRANHLDSFWFIMQSPVGIFLHGLHNQTSETVILTEEQAIETAMSLETVSV